ncbi:hypothetical protein JAAARDRAFT_210709 [Jaapia argillacea MUCL 33604]|uniref:Uncharacterized protein n=1 Tax=Jaapia argillacea MUCL 33604 TaxID=933084 RepID=A0A067PE60_9AGAM|nr:hypothetical protein JAAARDRAFT_210709 [Jaapia argillacea MUCL 33604]
MLITTTITAPTPLVAANFIILGKIIRRLESQHSRISTEWHMVVFCSCELLALVIQDIGDASASALQAAHQYKNAEMGGHNVWRYRLPAGCYHIRKVSPTKVQSSSLDKFPRAMAIDKNIRLMILSLTLSTITIFIRSVYRTVELADG